MIIRPELRDAQLIQENFENFFKATAKRTVKNDFIEFIYSDINHPLFNAVISTHCKVQDLDKLIDATIHEFKANNLSFCWWKSKLTEPAEIKEKLIEAGFKPSANFMGLIAEMNKITLPPEPNPQEIYIKEVEIPAELDNWAIPIQISFDIPQNATKAMVNIFKNLYSTNKFKHYMAYYKNQHVGSASLFFDTNTAGFYNLGVLPEFRKKGVARALQKIRFTEVEKRGYKTVVLQANAWSINLYTSIGFRQSGNYEGYILSFEI